jgi:hypothetical protein
MYEGAMTQEVDEYSRGFTSILERNYIKPVEVGSDILAGKLFGFECMANLRRCSPKVLEQL